MPRSKKKAAAKKTGAKKTTMSKAAFVRSQPRDMPAAQVIAKAAEAGITLTADTVYGTRADAKRAAKKQSSAGKGRSAKTGARGDKKQRVLELKAQNPDWSADQIAKAAKCSTTYVYSVWGGSKKRAGATNGTAKPKSPVMQHLDHVRALRGVILHVGVERAKEMMDQIVKDLMVLA